MYKPLFISILIAVINSLQEENSSVITLHPDNFEDLTNRNQEIWIVKLDESSSQKTSADFEKLAGAFEGILKFGEMNVEDYKNVVENVEIAEFPVIKIFNGPTTVPETYTTDFGLDVLTNFLYSIIYNKVNEKLGIKIQEPFSFERTVVLTGENFDRLVLQSSKAWLVIYYSQFCDVCRRSSTHWKLIAEQFEDLINFGSVEIISEVDVALKNDVKKHPLLVFYLPGGENKLNTKMAYEGPFISSEVAGWVGEKISERGSPSKLIEMVDLKAALKACDKKTVCIVSILPDLLCCDANCRKEYLGHLDKAKEIYNNPRWGWLWAETGAQPDVEAALGAEDGEHPTIAVVNLKRMKYSLAANLLLFEDIKGFLKEPFKIGEVKPITLNEVPNIKTVDPWNGLDVNLDESSEEAFNPKDEL